MDELDDIIGLLNSKKKSDKVKTDDLQDNIVDDNKPLKEEREGSVADRQLNIERMMNELEAMKKKKAELELKNNALKESQLRPQRDYSNSITRSTIANQSSGGSTMVRKSDTNKFRASMNQINENSEMEANEESKVLITRQSSVEKQAVQKIE